MGHYPLLDRIDTPDDLKRLPKEQLPGLCAEIREFLIENVSKTGGHLASNLGAVELTVGIHRCFSVPKDDIIFDVGHQCYIHKMLTGRKDRFQTLRQFGGISGFLRPDESKYDSVISGHASSSVSTALGQARAKILAGKESETVCIIGDGAFTGGMAYEAMNDAGLSRLPLIVVFNDNNMSISKNVGALAKRLSAIRVKPKYFRMKERTKQALSALPGGKGCIQGISVCKKRLRTAILKETIFELMGFEYLGPADGNDIEAVCTLLEQAKKLKKPVVVHLKTVKGKGYLPSEQAPSHFHGVAAFDVVTGQSIRKNEKQDFSAVFGETLCELAQQDEKICAVTAAMADGTGLSTFAKRFPSRFFDVGIAEQHAAAMSAGLAAKGMKPVCAIYSTFLQRAYDQIIHDAAISKQPVVFAVDRAGLVGADGETHQGEFDVPYLRTIPGMRLLSPSNYAELKHGLRLLLQEERGLSAIRYPRGAEGDFRDDTFSEPAVLLREGADVTVCAYGAMIHHALKAAELLGEEHIRVSVVKLNDLTPKDWNLPLAQAKKTGNLIVLEDCAEQGCVGQTIASEILKQGLCCKLRLLNLGEQFIPQGTVQQLYSAYHIDAQAVADAAKEMLHG